MTQDYVAAYRAFAGNGAGRAPAWLRDLRERSIARFDELGFPTPKHEEWRFTNVAPIAGTAFRLAGPSAVRLAPSVVAPFVLGGAEQHCLVFVNGRFSAELSRTSPWPEGVRVGSLAEALGGDPGLIERHLGAQAAQSAFAALNTAFVADGAYVHVPAGVQLAAPVQLLYLALPGSEPLVMHPRR